MQLKWRLITIRVMFDEPLQLKEQSLKLLWAELVTHEIEPVVT